MNYKINFFCILFFMAQFTYCTNRNYNKLDTIKHVTFNHKVVILPNQKNKYQDIKVFYKCNFNNGLILGGVENVIFEDCTFKNHGAILGGKQNDQGVRFGTKNITFKNCAFDSVTENGIITRRNYYDHFSLKIVGCKFSNWGIHNNTPCHKRCDDPNCNPHDCKHRCKCIKHCERCSNPYNKFDHAIYMRATNYLIQNNIFIHTTGGGAISCRTAGKIVENKVFGIQSGVGIALEYFPHKKWGNRGILQIEGNLFVEQTQNKKLLKNDPICECSNAGKAVLIVKSTNDEKTVDSLFVRYNSIILEESESKNTQFYPFRFSDDFKNRTPIIYGNTIADFTRNIHAKDILVNEDYNYFSSYKSDFILDSLSYDSTGSSKNYILSQKSLGYKLFTKKKLPNFEQLKSIYIVEDKISAGHH